MGVVFLLIGAPRLMLPLLFLLLFNVLCGGDFAEAYSYRRGRQAETGKPTRTWRQSPICVDELNKNPEEHGLQRFTWIFDFYRNNNSYIPVARIKPEGSPSGMITQFKLSSIHVEDKNSGYNSVLKNWVHIEMTSLVDLEGLYVQAISGPWGVPFGEFFGHFDCSDCSSKMADLKDGIHIIPCIKRPALSPVHPNVFTIGGDPIDPSAEKERVYFRNVHFNFRYIQFPCAEHKLLQFLVIAVRSFKGHFTRFETFYTQIFEMKVDDNPIGSYYPMYDGWIDSQSTDIKCHGTNALVDITAWSEHTEKTKVRYSKDFDYCLVNDASSWYTCGPGPISITETEVPTNIAEWNDFRDRYEYEGNEDEWKNAGLNFNTSFGKYTGICYDGGIWSWTVGKLEWPLPNYILVVEGGGIGLNVTVEGEIPTNNWTSGLSCEEIGSMIKCTNDETKTETDDCTDYQIRNCDQNMLIKYDITPLYGRDPQTGKYSLSDRKCTTELNFTQQVDVVGIGWGNKYIFIIHGKLLIFAWTVGWNVLTFTARFMKEYTVIEPKTSYFGIGWWLWHHMGWTYGSAATMLAGVYLMFHQHASIRPEFVDNSTGKATVLPTSDLHDLCNLHLAPKEYHYCLSSERKIHNKIGGTAVFFFFLSYFSGWTRPLNRMLRTFLISYHFGMAYLGKLLFYVVIGLGCLSEHQVIQMDTAMGVAITDLASLIVFLAATFMNCMIDRKFGIRGRSYFPVPEGIETYDVPIRMRKVIHLMLPVHILIQCFCFFVLLKSFKTEKDLCIRDRLG